MSSERSEAPPATWSDLTTEQRRELLALAESLGDDERAAELDSGRRDLMKAGGALLTGGLIGGGASQALSEPGAASHGGGGVGTPGDRVDIYGHDVDARSVITDEAQVTGTTDIPLSVPTDVSTLNEAVELASEYVQPRNGVQTVITIESGHEVSETVNIEHGNYSYIRITSADATVPASVGAGNNLFFISNAHAPQIDALFDMQGVGSDGIGIQRGSTLDLTSGSGVINAGNHGLYSPRSGIIDASDTDFSGAGNDGVQVQNSTVISAARSDVSGATNTGLRISRGAWFAGTDVNATGCGEFGADIRRSYGFVEDIDVSNAGGAGLRVRWGSFAAARNMTANGVGGTGIYAENCSNVDADNVSIDAPANNGIRTGAGASISAVGASITNVTGEFLYPVRCAGARATITDASIDTNPDEPEIAAIEGSIISAHDVTVGGAAIGAGNTTLSSLNAVESGGIIFN